LRQLSGDQLSGPTPWAFDVNGLKRVKAALMSPASLQADSTAIAPLQLDPLPGVPDSRAASLLWNGVILHLREPLTAEACMEDRPEFEKRDGAVVHPILAPNPGRMSAKEIADAELGALLGYSLRGGGGEPWYFGLTHQRKR
jgi:hypothetical protein